MLGSKEYTNHFINIKINKIIIGVKSIGQKLVGIIFLTLLYIGSIISDTNFGLILSQTKLNQDKIISIIIINLIMSVNNNIDNRIVVIIFYLLI